MVRTSRRGRDNPGSTPGVDMFNFHAMRFSMCRGIARATLNRTRGLVAMTSAQHAEGRQFDPGRVYLFFEKRNHL